MLKMSLGLMCLLFCTASVYANINCSCTHYYSQNETPSWVGVDSSNGTQYSSSGSTLCSGLKTIDERRSALEARKSLTKLLSTEISITEQSNLNTINSMSQSQFKSTAKVTSEELLKNATIFDRWVDTKNCIVYAGVTIFNSDIESAQAEKTLQKKSQLMAQNNCIRSTGAAADIVKNILSEKLLQNGFNVTNSACNVFYDVKNKITRNTSDTVFTQLQVKVTTKKDTYLLQGRYQGKGLSFSPKSTQQLLEIASEDSLSILIDDISKLKHTAVN